MAFALVSLKRHFILINLFLLHLCVGRERAQYIVVL
jgi:hypothetical protein